MVRLITHLILLVVLVGVADARYCNNPNCKMCNRIFGPMPGYTSVSSNAYVRQRQQVTSVKRATCCPVKEPVVVKDVDTNNIDIDSTPQHLVEAALRLAAPRKYDLLYDLGCGDGRVLIEAVKKYGCYGVGVEIEPDRVQKARDNVKSQGLGDKICILENDFNNVNMSDANIVYMYLYPNDMKKVLPKLGSAHTIVSINHELPGLRQMKYTIGKAAVYVYTKTEGK